MNRIVPADVSDQRTKRTARTRTIGVRVTEPEYLAIEGEALRAGKTVADWARAHIRSRSTSANGASAQERTLTELVGIELLLINALPPLLRGERIPQDRVEALWKQLQATKARKAQELLGKEPNDEEKH